MYDLQETLLAENCSLKNVLATVQSVQPFNLILLSPFQNKLDHSILLKVFKSNCEFKGDLVT